MKNSDQKDPTNAPDFRVPLRPRGHNRSWGSDDWQRLLTAHFSGGTDEVGQPTEVSPLLRLTSDGSMLAELLQTLETSPGDGIELGGTPLFSDNTINAILGEQLREVAAQAVKDEGGVDGAGLFGPEPAAGQSKASRSSTDQAAQKASLPMSLSQVTAALQDEHAQIVASSGILTTELSAPSVSAAYVFPTSVAVHQQQQQVSMMANVPPPSLNATLLTPSTAVYGAPASFGGGTVGNNYVSHQQQQQYVTLLDGRVLQQADGSAVLATMPTSLSTPAQMQLPGTSSVLHYVPVLNSNVVAITPPTSTVYQAAPLQVPAAASRATDIMATQQLLATALEQQQHLQAAAAALAMPPPPPKQPQPQSQPPKKKDWAMIFQDRSDSDGVGQSKSMPVTIPVLRPAGGARDNAPEHALPNRPCHKRDRSLRSANPLQSLDASVAPTIKLARADGQLMAEGQNEQEQEQNQEQNQERCQQIFVNKKTSMSPDSLFLTPLSTPGSCGDASPLAADAVLGLAGPNDSEALEKQTTMQGEGLVSNQPMLRHKDSTEPSSHQGEVGAHHSLVAQQGKRRGRPPGRPNVGAPPAPNEPREVGDAEILELLVSQDPSRLSLSSEELKKLIRKEKNKISAAISRHRTQHYTAVLESQVKKLQQEQEALSGWLTSPPEAPPHRILLKGIHGVLLPGQAANQGRGQQGKNDGSGPSGASTDIQTALQRPVRHLSL